MENKKNNSRPHSTVDNKKSNDNELLSASTKNENGENSKKYQFYRKPSIKKKGPEVKQTKTSLKRLLQANPLLQYEGVEDQKLIRQNSIKLDNKNKPMTQNETGPKTNKKTSASKNPNTQQWKSKPRISAILSGNGSENIGPLHKSAGMQVEFSASTPRPGAITAQLKPHDSFKIPSSKLNTKPKTSTVKQAPVLIVPEKADSGKSSRQRLLNPCKPIRRSLSAQHFDRKRGNLKMVTCSNGLINKTQSSEDVFTPILQDPSVNGVSPIAEVSHENLIFKTPSAHQRRSICQFTPRSTNISRRSIYNPSTPLPTLEALQKRLNEWLAKRGKSVSLFHHLKSFHPSEPLEDENKENIEIDQDLDKGSYEDLGVLKPEMKNGCEVINGNWESIAKAALVDLNNLIQEGYTISQCEEWLELIRAKYSKLQEEPEYWECRAAIEQSRGNISNAVECYRTAIVQGAEVQVVDKSLDVLLQKFSLLNISVENVDEKSVNKDRARIVRDARNVFKSSIIKFAVQEKKMKTNNTEVKLIATPVRRSTRLSRSTYSLTPGVKICSSLRELESTQKVDFVQNKALN